MSAFQVSSVVQNFYTFREAEGLISPRAIIFQVAFLFSHGLPR